jgi:Virulence factor membrane-bound polymerase, C-terminal/O-Antigen ligase
VARLVWGALGCYGLMVAGLPWLADWVGNASSGLLGRMDEGAAGFSRLALYSNTLDLIAAKPWLGWGWRELGYAHYSTHFAPRFMELLDNAHNLPLHLAVELGLPFALAFCAALVWWVWRSAPWRETGAARQLAWAVLLLIGLHSLVEYPLWYGPFLMTLGLCVGVLQRVDGQGDGVFLPSLRSFVAIKCVAVVVLGFTLYAALDYHRVSQIYMSTESRSRWYGDDALATAQGSVLFTRQARFAELMVTSITPQTAPRVLTLALDLVHYSPEPRVIEALIESATMLHFDDVAVVHLARYKEAYPREYAAWSVVK